MTLHKLLIANRGEIACRIARTARRLGLAVAGVHSSADAAARHVREIGESFRLGGPTAAESYLNIEAVVGAALRCGADAVHPGYGFLSENADFARAVEAAGLVFVGPRPETLERVGGKASAKLEARRLGIPVVAGSEGALDEPAAVAALVRTLPLPVLLKAVAGGGGRGMAVITSLDGLEARIDGAMREARASFGHGALIVEQYLPRVRHIEVQVAGDGQGQAIHLFERECSLQRRHQKLVEEAPAAALPAPLRDAMCSDACRLAAAVAYRGLGTVEFIVAGGAYHFLEVNPRLQVEHPVTEAVTGLDLVELQLRIAAEGRLPLAQAEVRCQGHAIEARLCAEDADAGFLPATGRISLARFPAAPLRVDAGVDSGDEVSAFYDSMLAKLTAHGPDREAARLQLLAGLQQTTLLGVVHNAGFLAQMLQWPETIDSSFHTRSIDERLLANAANAAAPAAHPPPPWQHLAAVALAWLEQQRRGSDGLGCWGQWGHFTGWRAGADDGAPAGLPMLLLRAGSSEWALRFGALGADGSMAVAVGNDTRRLQLLPAGPTQRLLRGDEGSWAVTLACQTAPDGQRWQVASALGCHDLLALPWLGGVAMQAAASGLLTAPMMGKVVALHATAGQAVAGGQTVVVLESMKMELHVAAPFDATVQVLHCQLGEMVERGALLAEVAPAGAAGG